MGGSSLTFSPGANHAYINITIFDDPTAEDDKYFEVKLLNPTGGAHLGVGSVVRVIISHSDDAYGVFRFANKSFIKLTKEPEGTAPTKVSLMVSLEGAQVCTD
jgi:G-protein coupled receptor 98